MTDEENEEEKKAIDLLKILQKKTPFILWGDKTPYNKSNQIQTILNLIEKQQKEIEIKEKVIDEMVRSIFYLDSMSEYGYSNQEIKEYFYWKVEDDE